MLWQRDEAQGSEAAAVVRLTPSAIVGRPLRPDGSGRLRPADAVRLRLDRGRIAEVLPHDAGLGCAPSGDRVVLGDAEALLLPAFADPHVHLVACAADRVGLDLSVAHPASIGALLDRLASASAALPPGAWLRASGYDEAFLREHRHPTRRELDAAVRGRPLRLRHATRHASLLNGDGRARVEQAYGALDPGRSAHDPDGASGALVHDREPEITRVVGAIPEHELARAMGTLGRELARLGVVHVDDVTASNGAARVARLAAAVTSGELPQQVRAFVGHPEEVEPARRAGAGHVRIGGVKLLARSTDEVHTRDFRAAVEGARRAGLPIAVHAVEADVVDAVLDALASAPLRAAARRRGGPDEASPDRLEHCSLCPPELVRRIAAAGVAVVTQPAFLACRGDKYRRDVERPLWPWLYPLRSLRAAGVTLAASSDAPVVPCDPRIGLDAAVRRTTRAGDAIASSERIDDATALELFTTAPARLRGEQAVGLVPGAAADVLVVEPGSWRGDWRTLEVRHTLAAGRVIA